MGLARLRLDTYSALHEARAVHAALGYRPVEAFNDSAWAHCFFEKDL